MAKREQLTDYQHSQQAVQRPDVGVQDQFRARMPPAQYRYDSSLDPQLSWDENRERELTEWLLGLIQRSAREGEAKVFATPQEWKGGAVKVQSLVAAADLLRQLSAPFMNWAGKAERHEITVPTVPLFVHERHSTKAILEGIQSRKAKGATLDLFGDSHLEVGERLSAYEHRGPWANRLILGDSLQIMSSLLELEGLGGQVQVVYIDPPYGVKFGSNFQPFVRKRDVKHGPDADMTREPEMVKAYRDTWELGLHSYLTYLRDRFLLARELLHETGSVFVQISDENVHHVREVLDEVFGADNFCSLIVFQKTSSASGEGLASVNDFMLWYARDRTRVKYHQLYLQRSGEGWVNYDYVRLPDGTHRRMTPEERADWSILPTGAKVYRRDNLTSQRPAQEGDVRSYDFEGKSYSPGKGTFKTDKRGLDRLAAANRLEAYGTTLSYRRFASDFPFLPLNSLWDDTLTGGFAETRYYVVQTTAKVIERCILMTTDPGDLVLDPTCGSGTTAFVAEEWGRRWITCDTSRVPLALARQRLLTATFPYYELQEPGRGPAGGFVYRRRQNRKGEDAGGLVPHVTLRSVANDEQPQMEVLVDRPERIGGVVRVSGPFVVEGTITPAQGIEGGDSGTARRVDTHTDAATHIERMTQVLRQSKVLRLPGNRELVLADVRRTVDGELLHAEAVEANGKDRIAIVFGPEDGAISSDVVFEAAREAYFLKYQHLYFFGFAIQAKARELLEDRSKLRIPCTYVAVTPDVAMSDLLKTTRASEIFSITGLPDVAVKKTGKKNGDGDTLWQVELKGLDIFNPSTMEQEGIEAENLPAWLLDTDYDGLSFYATQVFFPKTSAWDNLQKSLKASFEPSVWEHLAGTTSEPFALGAKKRIAVKVIDERGNELMKVVDVAG